MNWYYYTVPYDTAIIHAYIKMNRADEALTRLKRDDQLWTVTAVDYHGIVSEDIVKENVDWDNRIIVEGFNRGFVARCKDRNA